MKRYYLYNLHFVNVLRKNNLFFFLFFIFLTVQKINAQVGTMYGTGMSICNIYNFSICPTQTITPLNYGNQNYSCNNTAQPDVAFNIMGNGWRVNKFGWFFTANANGLVRGYNSLGILQTFTFSPTNTITPLSYSGSFVQIAINGVATGSLMSQSDFSISLNPVAFGSNSYTYCNTLAPSIAISPIVPSAGGPWNYTWQPGNITGNPANVSPLVSTIYSVTATTAAGCSSTTTVAVNVNCCNLVLTPNTIVIDASCSSITGSVIINSITNGTPNYTVTESGLSLASNVSLPYTISGVSVGTHTYNVNSANGCNTTFTASIQQIGLPPNVSVISPVMLNCTSSTILNATSTSSATTFSWNGPNIISGSQTQSVTVDQIGNYTVSVTQGLCTNTAVVSVVSNSNIPIISITPSLSTICSSQTSTLIATGANTYTWSSSGPLSIGSGSLVTTNPTITTVYTVTGTLNTCTNTALTTVSVLPSPTLILSPNSNICQGLNSSVTLTVSGANTYNWVNASTLSSSTGSNVVASPSTTTIYTVIGLMALCSNTSVVTVSVNPSPTITAVSFTNTSCGLNNGSILIISSPANNTYTWSGGIASTTNTANSLAPGSYTVSAYNGACNTSTVLTVLNSIALQITSATITTSDCGMTNGVILVQDNYTNSTYSWSPNVSSTNSASNLSPSNYALTITNGPCSTSTVFIVPQLNGPSAINVNKNDAICESLNGNINIISILNGTAPYQYSFNNSSFSSVSTFSNLAQGTYTIAVKDVNSCVYTNTFTINKSFVSSSVQLTTNFPTCNSNDGSFVINNTTGGTAPFLWSFNGSPFSSVSVFEELGAGEYLLMIRDSNLCETNLLLEMPFDKNDYTLYVPNTFTPNEDLKNDTWFVKGTCINIFSCIIFNRWGEKIIELKDINEYWDGTYKGKNVPDGVYVYLIEAETNNGTVYKNGHITLFR